MRSFQGKTELYLIVEEYLLWRGGSTYLLLETALRKGYYTSLTSVLINNPKERKA